MTAPNYLAQQGWSYQACQQSVDFVAVIDAVLPSVAMIPSLSVALADAIQAPLAQKLSYASVAKSDECEAMSGRGRAKETIFSASLDAEEAIRLADNLVPAVPSKRVLKTWDELSPRSRIKARREPSTRGAGVASRDRRNVR